MTKKNEIWVDKPIKDVKHILGRGWVLICTDQSFKVGDKIQLEISDVERHPTNPKIVGLHIKNEIINLTKKEIK